MDHKKQCCEDENCIERHSPSAERCWTRGYQVPPMRNECWMLLKITSSMMQVIRVII